MPGAAGWRPPRCPALSRCLWFPVSASFDGKQHLRSLPVVNSVGYVLRFLAKLCRSLLCDDLFSHQPFPRGASACDGAQEKPEGRMESGRRRQLPLPAGSQGLRGAAPSPLLSCGRPRASKSGPARDNSTDRVPTQAAAGKGHCITAFRPLFS